MMIPEKNTILFTLIYRGKHYPAKTNRFQYNTLMTLISDHLAIPGFGLCCGMGSCGTCIVDVCDKDSRVIRSSLSCDIQVNDYLANTQIIVPESNY